MGDPRFVACHLPVVANFDRPRAERPEIRPGIWFGKHRRRQNLGAGQLWQPLRLLRIRAAAQNQLGRDFRPCRQRPHPNIATRQFFRHYHHRRFGHAKPAEFLRYGQPEYAHFGQRLNYLHRDQFVAHMPAMRVRRHLLIGKAAELIADHFQFIVKARGPKRSTSVVVLHAGDQGHARKGRVPFSHQPRRRSAGRARNPDIAKPGHFALTHRNAAVNLCQIFAKPDLQDQCFHCAKLAVALQSLAPRLQLPQAFGVGCKPRQRMGCELVFLKCRCGYLATNSHPRTQRLARIAKKRLYLWQSSCRQPNQPLNHG